MSNDNGEPSWQQQRFQQSYPNASPEVEPEPRKAETFDPDNPGASTVDEVKAYIEANPGQRQTVLDAEQAGKNRSTLVAWLEESE